MDITGSANGQGLLYLIMKYQPCGKQSQGQVAERLPDCYWDWNRWQGLKSCQLYDDDDNDGGGDGNRIFKLSSLHLEHDLWGT
jgi:hypothetical protein